MSIYSGSFGQIKHNQMDFIEDYKNLDDNPSDNDNTDGNELAPQDAENLIYENDKIRWTPNDAYN